MNAVQLVEVVPHEGKWSWLSKRVDTILSRGRLVVFVNSIDAAEELAQNFTDFLNKNAGCVHDGLDAPENMRIFAAFQKGNLDVLIATDVAVSFRLDRASNITVVSYDTPHDISAHTKRVGFTITSGGVGEAYTLLHDDDHAMATLLIEHFKQISHPISDELKALAVRPVAPEQASDSDEDLLAPGVQSFTLGLRPSLGPLIRPPTAVQSHAVAVQSRTLAMPVTSTQGSNQKPDIQTSSDIGQLTFEAVLPIGRLEMPVSIQEPVAEASVSTPTPSATTTQASAPTGATGSTASVSETLGDTLPSKPPVGEGGSPALCKEVAETVAGARIPSALVDQTTFQATEPTSKTEPKGSVSKTLADKTPSGPLAVKSGPPALPKQIAETAVGMRIPDAPVDQSTKQATAPTGKTVPKGSVTQTLTDKASSGPPVGEGRPPALQKQVAETVVGKRIPSAPVDQSTKQASVPTGKTVADKPPSGHVCSMTQSILSKLWQHSSEQPAGNGVSPANHKHDGKEAIAPAERTTTTTGWTRYKEDEKYTTAADTNVNPKHVGESLRTLTLEDRLELRRKSRAMAKRGAIAGGDIDSKRCLQEINDDDEDAAVVDIGGPDCPPRRNRKGTLGKGDQPLGENTDGAQAARSFSNIPLEIIDVAASGSVANGGANKAVEQIEDEDVVIQVDDSASATAAVRREQRKRRKVDASAAQAMPAQVVERPQAIDSPDAIL